MNQQSMTYAGTGVVYDVLDFFKRQCQLWAVLTDGYAGRLNAHAVPESRGESVHLVEMDGKTYGFVIEGLGTKNLVADIMQKITGKSYYDQVSICNAAMNFNDMATLGISPISYGVHVPSGGSEWFKGIGQTTDFATGTHEACRLARCIWGPGETPTLKGLVNPHTVALSAASWGVAKHKVLNQKDVRDGDSIIFLESSGIHANGLTLCRRIAERKDSFGRRMAHLLRPDKFPLLALPDGYKTRLWNDEMYGEVLLEPTHIYCDFVEDCLDDGIDLHYCVNITGHGFRKLMRPEGKFSYIIQRLPANMAIFDFIQRVGPVSDEEAYGNFNMGAGFALYVTPQDVDKVLEIGRRYKAAGRYGAMVAGYIEASEKKKVVIVPKGLVYEADSMNIR